MVSTTGLRRDAVSEVLVTGLRYQAGDDNASTVDGL